ncbi:PA14 domain-containing protein [Paenibacillus sp.]|uniref:PA14 domain-containing protein n=1 Tax=Paenibacillus sp. TaxID=58172 RepID=UPI002D221FA0|nr:PA14 domain-containing protein [Paenibacillus sp.]HZG54917.1 PA14 domain-containing protein [Paenibacillus sp.]
MSIASSNISFGASSLAPGKRRWWRTALAAVVSLAVVVPAGAGGRVADAAVTAPPVPLILDTDILDDVDDVGAIALAHALQDKGEANILGVVVDTNHLKSAYCVDALNTYFGNPNIPVGIKYPSSSANTNRYPDNCAGFPQDLSSTTVQEGWKLYRQLLANPNYDDVVIVSLGFMNQLSALLNSGPDTISPLTGAQLVAQKVKELVVMGGTYPNGADYFNFYYDKTSAKNVIDNWPGRIVFSGEGANVGTGWQLDHSPDTSPVKKAFRDFLGCDASPSCTRPSWDEVAVYAAVRKNDGLFAEIGPGTVTYNPSDNSTVYTSTPNKNHYYLDQLVTNAIAANAMEPLVSYVPFDQATAFVKGININGAAVTIDGNAWLSHTAAQAAGFSVGTGVTLTSNSVAAHPAVDASTSSMLTAGLRKSSTANLSQTIPNGAYYVSFWVKEELGAGSYAYNIVLENTTVGEVTSAQNGGWNRYGPYPVSVIDGVLNMDLALNAGQVGLHGIEIRQAPGGTGSLSREYWSGIAGTSIASIPLNSPPSGTSSLSKFEGPVNWSDNYGTRIRGYITPPATGTYTFSLAGDDDSELWLSTNDNPANKSKIAYFTGYTALRQWTKFPTQTSAPVSLTAGQRYYVEVLHKEGVGWDNLSVGWTGPGIPTTTVIAGPYLSPYTLTSSGGGFVKGININGGAVTIEGNAWLSYSAALSSGLTVSTVNTATNTRTPSPATDADTTSMLRTEIWRTGNATLNQTLANGNYAVYLWVMEDYQANFRSFDVKLEGTTKGQIATGAVGSWAKYGPYNVSVTDGSLTLDLVRITGDILLQGLAIYQQ